MSEDEFIDILSRVIMTVLVALVLGLCAAAVIRFVGWLL